jgi:integrase
MKVSHLTTDALLDYRSARLGKGVTPRTVNIDVTTLQSLLNWGVKNRVIGSNPIAHIGPLRHDNPKNRRPLVPEEVELLLAHGHEPWTSIWYCFLTTGIRCEELCSLKFTDVDAVNREIIIRSSVAKNHRERRIPIDERLFQMLEALRRAAPSRLPKERGGKKASKRILERFTREHVFVTTSATPLNQRNLYRALYADCKRAGIETRTKDSAGRLLTHVDLHSLRVTFATTAIGSGADPKSVQEILGHRTLEMTMRVYAKMNRNNKRAAILALPYAARPTNPPADVVDGAS